jgi:hypothetical protein
MPPLPPWSIFVSSFSGFLWPLSCSSGNIEITMNDDEKKRLADALAKADCSMIKEILREAESFLGAQLQAGLAADARAMTLAGFMAAIISILITGTGLLVAANIKIGPHVIATAVLIIFLIGALFSTVQAARPTEWNYTGNNPRFWISDIEKGRTLKDALAGQAALYAAGISKNADILDENQRWARLGLRLAGFGSALAFAIEGLVIFIKVSAGGSIM